MFGGKQSNRISKSTLSGRPIMKTSQAMSHSAVISATGKSGEWEASTRVLQEALRVGVAADVAVCNAAVSACEKSLRWERAVGLLFEAARRGLRPDAVHTTLYYTIYTIINIILCYIISYYTVFDYIILYYIILYYIILYCYLIVCHKPYYIMILHYIILQYIMLHCY